MAVPKETLCVTLCRSQTPWRCTTASPATDSREGRTEGDRRYGQPTGESAVSSRYRDQLQQITHTSEVVRGEVVRLGVPQTARGDPDPLQLVFSHHHLHHYLVPRVVQLCKAHAKMRSMQRLRSRGSQQQHSHHAPARARSETRL